MKAARICSLAVTALPWLAPGPATAQAPGDTVALFVPAFASDDTVGLRAATVLNLQIFQTLQKAPFPNPNGVFYNNDGLVIWSPEPLPVASHDSALAHARQFRAEMALWGTAWRYRDGVAVQAYLTVDDRVEAEAWRWTVTVPHEDGPVSLGVGLPRLRYEFTPIALANDAVQALESPASLEILADSGSATVIGRVGANFRAIRQAGEWVLITSGPVTGWLHVPQLSSRSEIVDFAGGIIRILRTDWIGAEQIFRRVLRKPASSAITVDAHLLKAFALARQGEDPLPDIEAARAIGPDDVVATKYECMAWVDLLAKATSESTAQRYREKLRQILDERRYQYSPQDPWFDKVRRLATGGSQ